MIGRNHFVVTSYHLGIGSYCFVSAASEVGCRGGGLPPLKFVSPERALLAREAGPFGQTDKAGLFNHDADIKTGIHDPIQAFLLI